MALLRPVYVVDAQGSLHDFPVAPVVFAQGDKLGLAVCDGLVVVDLLYQDLQSLHIGIFSVINNGLNCCFRLLLALVTDP